jgi:hypothetical protein
MTNDETEMIEHSSFVIRHWFIPNSTQAGHLPEDEVARKRLSTCRK